MALVLAANFEFACFFCLLLKRKQYVAYDGPYGKIWTKKEPITTLVSCPIINVYGKHILNATVSKLSLLMGQSVYSP